MVHASGFTTFSVKQNFATAWSASVLDTSWTKGLALLLADIPLGLPAASTRDDFVPVCSGLLRKGDVQRGVPVLCLNPLMPSYHPQIL